MAKALCGTLMDPDMKETGWMIRGMDEVRIEISSGWLSKRLHINPVQIVTNDQKVVRRMHLLLGNGSSCSLASKLV